MTIFKKILAVVFRSSMFKKWLVSCWNWAASAFSNTQTILLNFHLLWMTNNWRKQQQQQQRNPKVSIVSSSLRLPLSHYSKAPRQTIFSISIFFSLSTFYHFIYPLGKSGCLTWVRLQQPQEQRYPFLSVFAVFSCVQTQVWLPMLGIFNLRTYLDARDCTRGLYWHRTSLHWKLTLGWGRVEDDINDTLCARIKI